MSDLLNGNGGANGKEGRGVQAYRWFVSGGVALVGILLMRVLADVDRTAGKVDALGQQFGEWRGTTESRINAHAQRLDAHDRRNDQQDTKLDELTRWLFRRDPPRQPN